MGTVARGVLAGQTGMVEQPIERVTIDDALRFLLTIGGRARVGSILKSRRSLVLGAILVSITAAAAAVWDCFGPDSRTVDRAFGLLFVINFSWISGLFWNSTAGFLKLWFGWKTEGVAWPAEEDKTKQLASRTSVLMPIHNEEPARVYPGLQAVYESLAQTGHLGSFDFFILSDSTDPRIWIAERSGWRRLRTALGGQPRIFYRKRSRNTGKKAGNIADFCRKWGHCYDFMIILDADSLMTGDALVTLVRLMESNKEAGIIQAPSFAVNRSTLFARIQQFAGRLYGPLTFDGLAFWQRSDGNYWGHNAIIRVSAFMANCGLPSLPGQPPLGGYIRSHDFIEAALMRRAGWSVFLLPELSGSYEEAPPTVLDYVRRDLRWCQGNLQHLRILSARGFHPLSRLHLAVGIMSYMSSLFWLAFLVTGLLATVGYLHLSALDLQAPSVLQSSGKPLVGPLFPAGLLAAMVFMLLGPKIFGFVLLFRFKELATRFGGYGKAFLGVILETLFSALLAPVMMVFQAGFVIGTLLDRDSGWNSPQRDNQDVSAIEALRWLWPHSLTGLAFTMVAVHISPALLLLFSPVIAGLLFSVPLSCLSSRNTIGRRARKHGLFVIPEESAPPPILSRLQALSLYWRRVA